jgi:16S rRNA processing protein RimM
MTETNKILVGKIVAPQGLRGEVRVQTYTAHPTDFRDLNTGVKFIRAIPNSDVIIARVDGINDRNAAETLRGRELYIDRAALPALGPDEYYQTDLIGLAIINQSPATSHQPPKVIAIHNFGAGDILELDNGEMVSFANAVVDLKNKIIKV